MNSNQTLARAQIVEQLLEQHDVAVDDVTVSTESGDITVTVDADHVDHDPDDADSPVDPQKIGGGTVKSR